jgi:hypothetical protein
MANETKLIVETELPINFTVADGTGIEKGAFLTLSDPLTVATHSGANDLVGGVAYNEKIASDGVTKLAVLRRGIIKATLSGACTVGDPLVLDKSINHVTALSSTVGLSGSKIVGTALETGTNAETILVELDIRHTGGKQ